MEVGIYIVLIILLALFIYSQFKPVTGLRTLNVEAFQVELRKRHMLIDVREPHEFKGGCIPGAINIPLSHLQNRLSESRRISVSCFTAAAVCEAKRLRVCCSRTVMPILLICKEG